MSKIMSKTTKNSLKDLLIDYNSIIKPHNLTLLNNRINKPDHVSAGVGVVLVVPSRQIELLETIPLGHERVNYINSVEFVNSIEGYAYIIYDNTRKICEIVDVDGPVSMLRHVIESILTNLPNDTTLWVGIDIDDVRYSKFKNTLRQYEREGFGNPHICNSSPLGGLRNDNNGSYSLCLLKQNDLETQDSNISNEVNNVLAQYMNDKKGYCVLTTKLSDKTIKYFRKLSNMGSTMNGDGVITQKEIAGILVTTNVDDSLVYDLDVDKTSIVSGDEEGVNIAGGLYNFHSHPKEAYIRNDVKYGWPSAQDYIGFFSSAVEHDTILHIVVAVEGFYVLSVSSHWVNRKDDVDRSCIEFIAKNYDIRYAETDDETHTPVWYVNKINNILYENFPLFVVQYVPWSNASATFSTSYYRNGSNCFARESTFKKYEQIY